jgi:hypothetical protein
MLLTLTMILQTFGYQCDAEGYKQHYTVRKDEFRCRMAPQCYEWGPVDDVNH